MGRAWKELGILPCSHQTLADRYPKNGDVRVPTLAWFRNNLTALSQCRNLFFGAYCDKIYVYKPQFPSQKISSKPEMIIDVPRASLGLRGFYINPVKAHTINQLVVSDLGHEEIVAVACDNGDVVAYTTRSIYDAIERDTLDEPGAQSPRIRTILLRNVGESAWGLAVHKAARLIAVSSNAHYVTVFAFALCREPSPDRLHESDDEGLLPAGNISLNLEEWVQPLVYSESLLRRSTCNFVIILEAHTFNIPSIAFCNTDADPTGRYLVSTDIGGVILVWDIWQRKILSNLTAHPVRSLNYAGWGLACLDPRSCRLSNTVLETFGCQNVSYRSGIPGTVYNNTRSTNGVPDSSALHPAFLKIGNSPESAAGITAQAGAQLLAQLFESDDEDTNDEDEGEEPNSTTVYPTPIQNDSYMFNTPIGTDTILYDSEHEATPIRQASNAPSKSTVSILPFHIFHTSKSDIRLMSNIRYGPGAGDATGRKTVLCQQALNQKTPRGLHTSWAERLNMVLQIPELGVVAIAHQAGRVALLTMTKNLKNDRFGFRLEWILPFRTEEEAGIRPDVALLGMAIGPVQGYGKLSGFATAEPRDSKGFVNETRRFRLILTYSDHTMISYEIWRSITDSGSGTEDRLLLL